MLGGREMRSHPKNRTLEPLVPLPLVRAPVLPLALRAHQRLLHVVGVVQMALVPVVLGRRRDGPLGRREQRGGGVARGGRGGLLERLGQEVGPGVIEGGRVRVDVHGGDRRLLLLLGLLLPSHDAAAAAVAAEARGRGGATAVVLHHAIEAAHDSCAVGVKGRCQCVSEGVCVSWGWDIDIARESLQIEGWPLRSVCCWVVG